MKSGISQILIYQKLRLTAFEKTKKAEIYPKEEFPEYLYNKARFWGDQKNG